MKVFVVSSSNPIWRCEWNKAKKKNTKIDNTRKSTQHARWGAALRLVMDVSRDEIVMSSRSGYQNNILLLLVCVCFLCMFFVCAVCARTLMMRESEFLRFFLRVVFDIIFISSSKKNDSA